MISPSEAREALHALLPPHTQLVAIALKKDTSEAVALVHGDDPERWLVGTFAEDAGWVGSRQFGPDLDSMQRACSKFIELAAGYVREYPSWYTAAPPYRSVDGGSR